MEWFAPLLALLPVTPSLQDSVPTLAYELTLQGAPLPGVHVRLRLKGSSSGRTEFGVSREAGGVPGGMDLVDVTARTAAGLLEPLPRDSAPPSMQLAVEHEPGEALTIEYTIPSNGNRTSLDPGDYNRPMVESEYVHLVGSLAFLRPEHLDEWGPIQVDVSWNRFGEADWKTASSFGLGDVSFRTTPVGLCGSIFVAGRQLRLHERSIRGQEVMVAMAGQVWPFEDEAFADLSWAIVDQQRQFFGDDSQPWFLVNLTPVGEPGTGQLIRSGLGLTNALDVFLLDGRGLQDEPRPGQGMAHTLAHEMFHNWNGNLIVRADPTPLGTWFSEGLTNFYARRLLHRSGIIDLATYARILNGTIAEYALSPARALPNSVLLEQQWEDPTVHRMAYLRGDLAGSLIDHALRTHSDGEISLDDLLRALADEARASLDRGPSDGGRERVSTEDLISRIEKLTDSSFGARLRAIVIDGAAFDLPLDLFEPCLTGHLESVWKTDPGFDTAAIRETGRVAGVQPGSPAHVAGLRDGQRCTSYQFSEEAGKPVVSVTVTENGEDRQMHFSAAGDAVQVSVFKPDESAPRRCDEL